MYPLDLLATQVNTLLPRPHSCAVTHPKPQIWLVSSSTETLICNPLDLLATQVQTLLPRPRSCAVIHPKPQIGLVSSSTETLICNPLDLLATQVQTLPPCLAAARGVQLSPIATTRCSATCTYKQQHAPTNCYKYSFVWLDRLNIG